MITSVSGNDHSKTAEHAEIAENIFSANSAVSAVNVKP